MATTSNKITMSIYVYTTDALHIPIAALHDGNIPPPGFYPHRLIDYAPVN